MEIKGYSISTETDLSFEDAVKKVTEELAKEKFGVLTEIDVKATMKKKLDKDLPNYVILGACNPPFAYQSLTMEKEIGLLLPCNVIVYEDQGKTKVAAINPNEAMSVVKNPKLSEIAPKVMESLKRVIKSFDE